MALVEMKRLRAVALQSRRRVLLRQLRQLGCVEVEAAADSTGRKTCPRQRRKTPAPRNIWPRCNKQNRRWINTPPRKSGLCWPASRS